MNRPVASFSLAGLTLLMAASSSLALPLSEFEPASSRLTNRSAAGAAAARAWFDSRRSLVDRLLIPPVAPAANKGGPPTVDAWIGNGVRVCTEIFGQGLPSIVGDGVGGATVAFLDARSGAIDIYANRLDANGDYVSGWGGAGVAAIVADSFQVDVKAVTDNSGGTYIGCTEFWSDGSFYPRHVRLQRLTSAGTLSAGWPAAGKLVLNGANLGFALHADGAGGTLVQWTDINNQNRVMRLDGTGTAVSGWPALGVVVGTSEVFDFNIFPDGTGGFYAGWTSSDSVFCTRYGSNGALASGWTAAGKPVAAGGIIAIGAEVTRLSSGDVMITWIDFRTFEQDVYCTRVASNGTYPIPWAINGVPVCTALGSVVDARLVPDTAGGAVIFWVDGRSGGADAYYAQRITSTGGIAAGWTLDGVAMCSPSNDKFLGSVIADGSSGILATFEDLGSDLVTSDVFAQRIQANGTRPANFPADGVAVCTANGEQGSPVLASDGSGGAIVAWDDSRSGAFVYAARLAGDGTVPANAALVAASAEPGVARLHWFSADAGFAATLERDAAGAGWAPLASVHADGSGHVRYEDRDVTAGTTYRYRLVVDDDGQRRALGEVSVQIPAGLAFALDGLRPNPTSAEFTVAFTLPSAAPARLEVVDLAGRRVADHDLATLGAGRHVVRIEEAGTLPPGVYVLKLTQGRESRTARAVVAK